MLKKVFFITCYLFLANCIPLNAQDVSLFEQFNGRYDYLAIGNTLNPLENNGNTFCTILESSEASLNINANQTIIKAYLYWAGSGPGDSNVSLNGTPFSADDTYTVDYTTESNVELTYFSSYADITDFIVTNGNGIYTFSDLDINSVLLSNPGYCGNRTNFGGWSIYVIYEDTSLPLNQVSLFQGLQIINRNVGEIEINLNNINVFDNEGAKIGFLAWEGDNALNFGESLSINGNIISNPPLNLADNAFNGTNTFTNSTDFFNADLDVYSIENNIAIGDTSAIIRMTTGDFDDFGIFRADLIIINNIITVLNSKLPDATIRLDNSTVQCNSNSIALDYTVFNLNSTEQLPSNTPIAFYFDGVLIGQSQTTVAIPIGENEIGSIVLEIPEDVNSEITVLAMVDDIGNMTGIVDETDETNNTNTRVIELINSPEIEVLAPLKGCNEGFSTSTFNLYQAIEGNDYHPETIEFYESIEDLENGNDSILDPSSYNNTSIPQTIYIKIPDFPCYRILAFDLIIENCPPRIPQGFSPNDDQTNDWFNIQGLYNVFVDHDLKIFNRHGVLIFEGDNDQPWTGIINRGINGIGNRVPVGTYYFVLNLNDSDYRPMVGWVYVNY
ncbi:gliding motility-associated C-terminal domain-containing protein [Winogradskyella sp. DF17]|uniref:Gliding motility-associated C-terminal domain-containing protein n=1 Tax=Winogradskyella pelagia TaxID=2819984 RepID=A0ABS3T0C6_9FLAO|nr:gliding motility-associated C-terminal domain-containing protein [Winogradskyella sp. DF17]MBO3116205.1 gliding motility-associated C-terminal domain-containing protein [Winogradskyella sp. DF17]